MSNLINFSLVLFSIGILVCRTYPTVVPPSHTTTNRPIPYNNIICFGDSLTDTGNVNKLTNGAWPLPPPYYDNGRFSNGQMWPDFLLSRTSPITSEPITVHNYAYGGSTTNSSIVPGFTGVKSDIPSPDLNKQISFFMSQFESLTPQQRDQQFNKPLFSIWSGANDLFFGISTNKVSPQQIATNLISSIQMLDQFLFNQFQIKNYDVMILSIPSVRYLPYLQNDVSGSLHYDHLVTMVNAELKNRLAALNETRTGQGLTPVKFMDINYLSNSVFERPYQYGFPDNITQITQSCLQRKSNNGPITICDNPDTRIYWDKFHFTSRMHNIITRFIASSLVGY